ncbi:MAG TPA: 50S ribosomal protein L10 [Actinomycetota bacterium]
MPNTEKIEKVAALKERIQNADALLLAEYRGLSVHDATELRRSLSDTARFSVVKNTLMQRAAGDAGIEELEGLLTGSTAVAFVDGDVVAAAKKLVDAGKRFPALVLKGAYLDGKVLDQTSAQALATLESREVMLSKIAGMMKSEMVRAASVFQTLQGRFVGLLEAYRERLPSSDEAAASADREGQAAVGDEEAAPSATGVAESAAQPATEVAENAAPSETAPVEAEASEPVETSEAEPSVSTEEE